MSKKLVFKEKYLFGGIQTAYDTPATLTATSILLSQDLGVTAYGGDKEEIEYDGEAGRDVPVFVNNEYTMMQWNSWVRGSGTAGTAPVAGPFLRACGMDETIVATTSVAYSSLTDVSTLEYLTAEFRRKESDSAHYLYRMINAVGQVGIDLTAGQRARLNFTNFMGDYVRPSRVASWTAPTYGTQKTAIALQVNDDNTPTVTLDADDLCLQSLVIPNLGGWNVTRVDQPNCPGVEIEPVPIEGTIVFRQTDWATELNPWEYAETITGETRSVFQLVLGTTAGNILTLDSSEVQIIDPTHVEMPGGLTGVQATVRFLSGITLTFT